MKKKWDGVERRKTSPVRRRDGDVYRPGRFKIDGWFWREDRRKKAKQGAA
ncbi:MAG: hypothetical protein WC326_08370 [Candidatus Delongbacteria bacterium]